MSHAGLNPFPSHRRATDGVTVQSSPGQDAELLPEWIRRPRTATASGNGRWTGGGPDLQRTRDVDAGLSCLGGAPEAAAWWPPQSRHRPAALPEILDGGAPILLDGTHLLIWWRVEENFGINVVRKKVRSIHCVTERICMIL
ncbi:unnamed protein product [Urochloa humidicola]